MPCATALKDSTGSARTPSPSRLHTHPKLRNRLSPGIGIEVVRSPVVEAVALAKLVAYKQPNRSDTQTHGNPADRQQDRMAARIVCCVGYCLVFKHRKTPPEQIITHTQLRLSRVHEVTLWWD